MLNLMIVFKSNAGSQVDCGSSDSPSYVWGLYVFCSQNKFKHFNLKLCVQLHFMKSLFWIPWSKSENRETSFIFL